MNNWVDLTVYLLRCTGEDWRRNTLLRIVGGLWLVYFALLIVRWRSCRGTETAQSSR